MMKKINLKRVKNEKLKEINDSQLVNYLEIYLGF